MKYILLLVSGLLVAGCNPLTPIGTIATLGKNLEYDTNGYYSKRTGPDIKHCEYRVSANITAWRPCK